jgi:hypothetical protein
VAVRITMSSGRVDTLIYAGAAYEPLRVDDIEFQGHFGYWSEQDGKPRCMQLVDGATLARGSLGVRNVEPCFRTTVAAVDHVTREVTLEQELPAGATLAGRLIYFRHGSHRTAYHIAEEPAPGKKLKLDLDTIIFRSKIEKFAPDGSYIVCELPPRIPACGGARPHGYYDGAFVTSENLSAAHRVTRTVENRIYLTPRVQSKQFTDNDGDGRIMLCIHDIGAGDEVSIPHSHFLRFLR